MKLKWLSLAFLFAMQNAVALESHTSDVAMPLCTALYTDSIAMDHSFDGKDTLTVFTLADVSIIDFKTEHNNAFKNLTISSDLKRNSISSTLEDALKNTSPVYFKNYSYGGISTIDFRGTGAERTQVYWNGVPLNSPSLGVFDFSLLPSFFISDAKVRFGGASLVDGGGGIGGSIQLNHAYDFSQNSLSIQSNIGSFANYSTGVIAKFRNNKLKSDTRVLYHQAKNDFSFINNAKFGNPTERRINNELKRFSIQQALNFSLNESSSIAANVLYSALDRNIPPGISSSGQGAWQGDELFLGQVSYNKLFRKGMFFKIRSAYQNQINEFKDLGVDAKNTVNAWNNKLDFGVDFNGVLKINTSIRYDLNEVNTDGTGSVKENVFSALIALDYTFFRSFLFSAGARYEYRSGTDSPLMPFTGLSYLIPKNAGEIKVSIARVFRFPTINERYWQPGGNPDLKPELGWNYEVSYLLRKELTHFSFNFQVCAFYSRVSDWILWYPSIENALNWQAQNVWEVEAKGLEINGGLAYSTSSNSKVKFDFFYTFNASQISGVSYNDESLDGKQLILVPRHQLMLPLEIGINNYTLGVAYQYTSERFTDRLNERYLDPYHLLDLMANYSFEKPNLVLTFRLKNILNQQFETFPGQPLPGINFNLQIAWQLF